MTRTLTFLLLALASASAEITNISSRGQASQNTEWNGGQYPAANAIDGNTGTFSHTDATTAGNTWKLKFDREYAVSEIILTARGDCCGGRLNGTTLRVTSLAGESVFSLAVTDPGIGAETKIKPPAVVMGSQISIGFEGEAKNPEGNRALHLAEVKVMADVPIGPAVTLSVDKSNVSAGGAVTFTWKAPGAVETRLLPAPGDVTAMTVLGNGAVEVKPAKSARYMLLARDAVGWGSASVVVHVDGQPIPPRLTEFLADNDKALKDSDGKSPPWIEIHNADDVEVDLAKWAVTTDKTLAKKTALPALKLGPDAHAVLFLGDEAGRVALNLDDGNGSYLALLDANGAAANAFTDIPKQRTDVSYGIDSLGQSGYFPSPTPRAANGASLAGFVADTKFSIDGGFHDTAFDLAITSATPEAKIYVTRNGSVPSPTNSAATLYAAPLRVTTTAVIRAVAHREGYAPSNVDTQTYLFLADVTKQPKLPEGFPPSWGTAAGVQAKRPAESDYEMDPRVIAQAPWDDMNGQKFDMVDALKSIPTMSLVMDSAEMWDPKTGIHINARKKGRANERAASLEYFGKDGSRQFRVGCGVRITGGWGRYPEMLKKSFRLYFRGEYGAGELRYPLFPDSEVNSYDVITLRGGNGKAWPSPWRGLTGLTGNTLERTTYIRDEMVRRTQRDMGQVSAHGNFVHLYINGLYWGLYNACERINDGFAQTHFGGKAEDFDVVKWIRSEGPIKAASGNLDAWRALMTTARKSPDSAETLAKVAEVVDFDSLIDFMLTNIHAGNIDWQDNNTYAVRNRSGGRFRFVCWDGEETYLAPTDNNVSQAVGNTPGELFHLLRRNAEFRVLVGDHVQRHWFGDGAVTDAKIDARFMEMAREIDRAIVGESARWGDLMRPSKPYDRAIWLREIDNLRKNYWGQSTPVKSRRDTTLKQLAGLKLYPAIEAPLVDPPGGYVAMGTTVTIGKPSILSTGSVYYTLDGSDPRLAGGAPNPNALQTPATTIAIDKAVTLKARLFRENDWSALVEARYVVGASPTAKTLLISEIMYHPAGSTDSEFLELHNASDKELNLAGLSFAAGISFTFGNDVRLAPGERAVLVGDPAAFAKTHGNAVRVLGQFANASALSNGGEELTLLNAKGEVLHRIRYSDGGDWPEEADGQGSSLILTSPQADPANPASWKASPEKGGSPGKEDEAGHPIGGDLPPFAIDALGGSGPENRPRTSLDWIDGKPYGLFSHAVLSNLKEASVDIEQSKDLKTWTPLVFLPEKSEVLNDKLIRQSYRASDPVKPGERLYFRLKIVKVR